MRRITTAAIVAAQIVLAAQPALGAETIEAREPQVGAFGGVRVRLPLDGERRDRRLRAGLTLAPTLHGAAADGETRLRIGEGLEFGLEGGEPPRLRIGGQDLRRLDAQGDDDDGGVPTWAWIAGGVVVVLGAGWLWFEDAMNDASE
jgi:hypothetical protein